jgi:predicted RNA-binding protein with TRAM domain
MKDEHGLKGKKPVEGGKTHGIVITDLGTKGDWVEKVVGGEAIDQIQR